MTKKTPKRLQIKENLKSSGAAKQVEITKNLKEINPLHKLIIDEYYINGFNGSKAVLTVKPDIKHQSTAAALYTAIRKNPVNLSYIEQKSNRLSAKTDIKAEHIVQELMQWAYSDVTDFIGLEDKEIKELPPNIRRCLSSFKTTERTEKGRDGNEYTIKTTEFKLVDKLQAIKEISKHIGFYEAHNKQKSPIIDLTNATPEELNTLLGLFNRQLKVNS